MRKGITIAVNADDRARLEAVVADRNRPQKHVWRARIILLTADGVGTTEIERRTGKDKTCVALAEALHAGGCGRALARQDAALPQAAFGDHAAARP